ncbi:hypothetical protein, partial [Burkholderia sp. FL-7-2-10-S1-D7]|uniref:hypothetical protein n=1 Tax=Burkholderia sp. FL-7-2-10-S1-D7 TaxID=1637866 RepID=UPI001C54CA3F
MEFQLDALGVHTPYAQFLLYQVRCTGDGMAIRCAMPQAGGADEQAGGQASEWRGSLMHVS